MAPNTPGRSAETARRHAAAAPGPRALAIALVALLPACGGAPSAGDEHGAELTASAGVDPATYTDLAVPISARRLATLTRLSPLPAPPPSPTNRVADSPAAARLGQALFFDARLSGDGTVSCASCHDPARGFTDGKTLAVGVSQGNRHTPTLWNVAYHRWLTWDGRADSLWMQALDPMEDPREMAGTRGSIAHLIATDPELSRAFADAFGEVPAGADGGTGARPARRGEEANDSTRQWNALGAETRAAIDEVFVGAGKSLGAYQRLLVRGDAPFDRFVEGLLEDDAPKRAALSPSAQRGLDLFLGRANCALCHNGPNFSDGEFHNNALPTLHGGEPADPGRYDGAKVVKASPFNATGPHSDDPAGNAATQIHGLRQTSETWGEFRTPSLRNLRGRAPFMHQGQLATLDDVLEFYSELEGVSGRNHHQEQILVPLRLGDGEKGDLKAFLAALEGAPAEARLLVAPDSPGLDPESSR